MNTTPKNKIGRPGGEVIYNNVLYLNNNYTVCSLKSKDEDVKFVIDTEDFEKIKKLSWHKASNNYISNGVIVDGKRKEVYLHNLIMDRIEFKGKGLKESVDHINRIGFDNRKENLRVITQSEQNLNQSKRSRKVELPEDSELLADDIPKHIWYVKANGNHGDRFAIELKTENISWKTTSSKNILLKDKLQTAKDKLQEYYKLYPHLNPNSDDINNRVKELTDSYNEIIKISELQKNIIIQPDSSIKVITNMNSEINKEIKRWTRYNLYRAILNNNCDAFLFKNMKNLMDNEFETLSIEIKNETDNEKCLKKLGTFLNTLNMRRKREKKAN
jgi:hypothetical protein